MYKQHRIPSLFVRLFSGALAALSVLASAGCGSVDKASTSLVSMVTPYRMEVVQGNVVSKEQAQLITPGMSRTQVRTILGTPLLTDIFHPERWDYVFSIKRQGVEPLEQRFTVFFDDDIVTKTQASQELLSEEEFVLHLESNKDDKGFKEPVLQATPEQLEAAAQEAQAYREREQRIHDADEEGAARPSGYYPPLDSMY